MVYNVIGLMSGSSLDGLDICFAQIEENRGKWTAEIIEVACYAYPEDWALNLKNASALEVPDFLKLHTAYGRFTGKLVLQFIEDFKLQHKVHFVVSHGHTVFHEPQFATTFQLGDGASIAATIGLPVISDLRSLDIALGGQGAPIVPIGDKLLFGAYDMLLNIGGICNISIKQDDGSYVGFDISAANQALNYLVAPKGLKYDEGGVLASKGQLLQGELEKLCAEVYYQKTAPKSLSNANAMQMVMPFLENENYSTEDKLNTIVHLIVEQIYQAILPYKTTSKEETKNLLVTGGGAFNSFLIALLTEKLSAINVSVVVPDTKIVAYKEALVMALIGTLRWREEANVMASQTGASKDSVGGAFWIGN